MPVPFSQLKITGSRARKATTVKNIGLGIRSAVSSDEFPNMCPLSRFHSIGHAFKELLLIAHCFDDPTDSLLIVSTVILDNTRNTSFSL
jgi:hypothetical protein